MGQLRTTMVQRRVINSAQICGGFSLKQFGADTVNA